MSYLAIMKVANGRAAKYQPFSTEAEAAAHVVAFKDKFPAGYVVQDPGSGSSAWLCDPVAKTVVVSPPEPTVDQVNTPIFKQIAAKEALTLRPVRELLRAIAFDDVPASAVTAAKSKIKAIDDEIKALRAQLVS